MQQSSLQLSLGPGPLNSAYDKISGISNENWQSIKSFVQSILDLSHEERQIMSTWVSDIPKLYQSCLQWQRLTQPQLDQLGSMLVDFNETSIQPSYQKLSTLLGQISLQDKDRLQSTPVQEFNATMEQIVGDTAQCEAIALSVSGEMSYFVQTVDLCHQEVQSHLQPQVLSTFEGAARSFDAIPSSPITVIQQLAQLLSKITSALAEMSSPPLKTLQQIQGGWSAVKSDLIYTQQWVNQQIQVQKPFISQLNVEVAKNEWNEITKKANLFSQNIHQ